MADTINTEKENGQENEQQNECQDSKKIVWRARKRLWCGLPFTFTVYSMSRDRLFIKRGVLNIQEDEVRLYRIRDISLRRTFLQRLFGLGTLNVCSTDSNLRDFKIINIPRSKEVKEQLSEMVEAERQRKRVSARELMGSHEEMNEEDFDDFDNQA